MIGMQGPGPAGRREETIEEVVAQIEKDQGGPTVPLAAVIDALESSGSPAEFAGKLDRLSMPPLGEAEAPKVKP